MYLCYVDESGDPGYYDPANSPKSGSPYFILAGLIVHSSKWKHSLDILKIFRKKIEAEAYLPFDVEFHCSELIDPHKLKVYTQISVPDRWKLIERFASVIGTNNSFSIIPIVIDKRLPDAKTEDYLFLAVSKLYLAFEEFLQTRKEHGALFFDRGNTKHINSHVKKLMLYTLSDDSPGHTSIERVIEDPIFRLSHDSLFIQAADVIAFTLKEKEFPQTSRKKHNADRIFAKNLKRICVEM